jgi:predicted enzyme related to lactoylglutathione lyase
VRFTRSLFLATAVSLLALVGCAGITSVPPITTADSSSRREGDFVWHDLLTEDLPNAERFYGELFGWTFTETEVPGYSLIEYRGRPIGGIVDTATRNSKVNESQWVSVLSILDVDAAVDAVRASGGAVHVRPTDLPGRGRLAVVSDPRGALFALLRTTTGDPPDRKVEIGDWMWTELWTLDLEASAAFYSELAGYELEQRTILEGIDYDVFTLGGRPRAGLIPMPEKSVRAHWLPYVRVDDAAALAEKVEGLGGRVLLDPSRGERRGTVAIVLDPTGAPLALQEWEDPS